MNSEYYLAAGSTAGGAYEVEVTPESAGWGFSSLRIVELAAGDTYGLATDGDEVIVVPLSGGAEVTIGGVVFCSLTGRPNVFAGPTDVAYLAPETSVELASAAGGRFALCGARVPEQAAGGVASRHLPVAEVPVELRGAGQSSRQVRNFGTPDTLPASKIIACEVITPAGNWSSYPAHKHDETTASESELEEIYYFEIASGPDGQPGFGFMRTSSSPGRDIDLLEEVHDRDLVLVPYGWHGPCVAAPGFDMYYLNVMAGPGAERAWKISDHPDHAWVRGTWEHQDPDPRIVDPRLIAKDA
ncbi:MAG TPA: 5-deoxy-glucuronate isomerase [Microlunatus sp.]|nr:5-deoxy-glucuronate isomerase [Microlunatus sp.]